jgi:hypothetical protein
MTAKWCDGRATRHPRSREPIIIAVSLHHRLNLLVNWEWLK